MLFQLSAHCQEQLVQASELNSKRETLAQQLSKLQKECRDMAAKEKDLGRVREQLEQATQEREAIKQQMQEVVQDKIGFKVKLEEQREKLEMLVAESAELKKRASEYEDHKKQLKSQIKQLQGQLDLREDCKLQAERSQQELHWAETQLRAKEAETDELRKTVQSLQRALQHQHEEHEQGLRLKERAQAEDKALLQGLQAQILEMKDRIREAAEVQA